MDQRIIEAMAVEALYWKCFICAKMLTAHRGTFIRHIETHNPNPQLHKCRCGKGFRNKAYLLQHSKTHRRKGRPQR